MKASNRGISNKVIEYLSGYACLVKLLVFLFMDKRNSRSTKTFTLTERHRLMKSIGHMLHYYEGSFHFIT
jgi:hypothetical protein